MSVVNCKVQYIRPKYNNLKEWCSDNKNVYIGRGGVLFIDKKRYPPYSSNFANPYKVGRDGTGEEVIAKYRKHITKKLESDKSFVDELLSLKGKNLGCWCHPNFCHGNIVLELINKYSTPSVAYDEKKIIQEKQNKKRKRIIIIEDDTSNESV
jgi:hypothetical protein